MPDPMPDDPPKRRRSVEILLGFLCVWLLNMVQSMFTYLWAFQWKFWTLNGNSWLSASFLGVTQLFYVVPVAIYAHLRGRKTFLVSAVIAASLTFLLTTACWALERALFSAGP